MVAAEFFRFSVRFLGIFGDFGVNALGLLITFARRHRYLGSGSILGFSIPKHASRGGHRSDRVDAIEGCIGVDGGVMVLAIITFSIVGIFLNG